MALQKTEIDLDKNLLKFGIRTSVGKTLKSSGKVIILASNGPLEDWSKLVVKNGQNCQLGILNCG